MTESLDPILTVWLNEDSHPRGEGGVVYDISESELVELVARVREDERGYAKQTSTAIMAYDEGRRDGYAAGVAAARNAVHRMDWMYDEGCVNHVVQVDEALAAIDRAAGLATGGLFTGPPIPTGDGCVMPRISPLAAIEALRGSENPDTPLSAESPDRGMR